MGNIAAGQEVGAGSEKISEPEDLPICEQQEAFIGAPALQAQPAATMAQQGPFDESQQSLIVKQQRAQGILKTLGNKADQMFGLRVRPVLILLQRPVPQQLQAQRLGETFHGPPCSERRRR